MALAAIAAATLTPSQASAVQRVAVGCGHSRAVRLCSIRVHYRLSNQLRAATGLPAQPYAGLAETHPTLRTQILSMWTQAHRRALRRWHAWTAAPWLHGAWYQAALCVHSLEGSWSDPNAPYYGGMQMDLGFQQAYGAAYLATYGTADHWPPRDQLHAAFRAWQTRGWTPWPTTAAACGLL